MSGVLISDNFEEGKATMTRIENLSDKALNKLVVAGSRDAAEELARRIKARRR